MSSLAHALSGGLGGAIAITVFFPLECVRTRLQVDSKAKSQLSFRVIADVYRTEGWTGLYRGWRSIVVAYFITQCVYFYAFHGMRSYLSVYEGAWQSGVDLFVGISAGALAVLVSNPLWVVNTRLKLQGAKLQTQNDMSEAKYTGIIDCLLKVSQHEGWRALWSALLPSLVLVCNPAVQFMAYEALKTTSFLQSLLDSQRYFILGAIAKIIATVLTYPLQVRQTCIRAGVSLFGGDQHVQLFSWKWLKAQYRGLEAKLTQTVLTSAMMFMTYEKINLWILTKPQTT